MGHDPHGRRHASPAWLDLIQTDNLLARGRKLVVQMVETFQGNGQPTFVESLDAVEVARSSGMPLAPVMIYGDDVSHVLTEEGIAYLYKAESLEQRRQMIAAVAGITPSACARPGQHRQPAPGRAGGPAGRPGHTPQRCQP
jgi:malonate decarboxylase alpha subunit